MAVISGGVLFGQNLLTVPQSANAITPPDTCFATTGTTTLTITKYYNNESNNSANPACPKAVDIPATIGGIPVTSIGTYAFSSAQLTAVTIPNGITTIGDSAFYSNQLTSVVIPNSVTSLGQAAFNINRLTSVTIPDSVTVIKDMTFYQNNLTSVTIPSSVTSIGLYAFSNNNLTSVTIPSSVTNISGYAFRSNKLASVTVAGSPATIGTDVLQDNPVQTISYNGIVHTAPTSLTQLADACFAFSAGTITGYNLADLAVLKNTGAACIAYNISLPSTIGGVAVTGIGHNAFSSKFLTGVTIPSSVTSLGDSAFQGDFLTSITVPGTITSVGNAVFYSNNLTSVTIMNGLTSIGSSMFAGNRLTSITIPSSVTSIGYTAFGYNKLTSVTLSNGLTTIGDYAFMENSITSVTIPDSVTGISPTAFVMQNPWDGDIENNVNGVPYLWSSDPTVVQHTYDSIWYVRLYTADPTNPNHIANSAVSENDYLGSDANGNGTLADSIGGHIVNPARAVITALDKNGSALQSPSYITGAKTGGSLLTDYGVTASGNFAPLSSSSPTTAEQAAMNAGFAQYNRIGQTISVKAPVITGQVLMSPISPVSETLAGADNTVDFHYTTPVTSVTFAAPVGSEANPTQNLVPANVPTVVSGSIFSVDTSKSCQQIDSAKLLDSTNFVAPTDGYTTAGGVSFTLSCAQSGGEATPKLILGSQVAHPDTLKIYKRTANGVVTDITSQVTISNQTTPNGIKTVISYNLVDGGPLDDDGVVNGVIVDPVYIAFPTGSAELANTGESLWLPLSIAGLMMVGGTLAITLVLRRQKNR